VSVEMSIFAKNIEPSFFKPDFSMFYQKDVFSSNKLLEIAVDDFWLGVRFSSFKPIK
jgi:hypothetical protein